MMDALSLGLGVLNAMITPSVLISACGTLISTSNRLGRTVDRVRELAEKEGLTHEASRDPLGQRRPSQILNQLPLLTRRVRLLQRGLTTFHLAVGIFVATSVAIGVVGLTNYPYGWVPVVGGLTGACFLLYGSVLMIV